MIEIGIGELRVNLHADTPQACEPHQHLRQPRQQQLMDQLVHANICAAWHRLKIATARTFIPL